MACPYLKAEPGLAQGEALRCAEPEWTETAELRSAPAR
jgi:hypothetical protein